MVLTILDYFNLKKPLKSGSLLDEPLAPQNGMLSLALREGHPIQAITVTLRPDWHKEDPRKVDYLFRNSIKNLLRKCPHTTYTEFHSEYTQNNVLHWHGWATAPRYWLAKLSAHCRKHYGFIQIKTPNDLAGWIEYCNGKKQDGTMKDSYNEFRMIQVVTKARRACKKKK